MLHLKLCEWLYLQQELQKIKSFFYNDTQYLQTLMICEYKLFAHDFIYFKAEITGQSFTKIIIVKIQCRNS